jgi:hypothetical protein
MSMNIRVSNGIKIAVAALCLLFLPLTQADAVPSFARQTGMQCSDCHTVFPQLTAVGRDFKVNGYTWTNVTKGQSPGLKENIYAPVSAMLLVSYSRSKTTQPDTQNGNVLLPDQLSLFYAGRISDKAGAFSQVTYSQPDDHFSMDNTDIRFAGSAKGIIYGVTVNNNPTVQDLWNSTPAWGFPFISSGVAPTPAAATQVDGTLAQQVAGAGVYGFWNNLLYGEVTFYRASQVGGSQPPNSATDTNVLSGTAPYWRLAVQHDWGNHSAEVGTFGMILQTSPGGGIGFGATDRFRDYAFDTQYQFSSGVNAITVHGSWIGELQDWNASFPAGLTSNTSDRLTTIKVDGSYYYNHKVGATIAYFSTTGTPDTTLYAPADVTGSASGNPDSKGYIAELDYLPWENTKFVAQYVIYSEFNGGTSNYDGSGRNAKDNNTLYVAAWLMF